MKQNFAHCNNFEKLFKPPLPAYVASSISILYDINNSDYDEDFKKKCLKQVIEGIIWLHDVNCAVELLYQIVSTLEDHHDEKFKSFNSLVKQVLNHPEVIESYTTTHTSYIHNAYIVKIASYIGELFTDETVLKILHLNPDENIFVMFGYHPVLLKHVELQKKWIRYYSKYKIVEPIFGIRNITDEALLSVPEDEAFDFIKKNFLPWNAKELIIHMLNFKLETVKRIVLIHIIKHGMDEDANYVLRCIEKLQELQSSQ